MQCLNVLGSRGDEGISPVVGVMLMLVVVIIVAAVVSGFAGGLVGGTSQKAPTLAMDVKVVNMGSWTGSGLFATVTGVSKPIPTGDIKIVTSWTAANGTMPLSGGNTTLPGGQGQYINIDPRINTYYLFGGITERPFTTFNERYYWIAPWGGGPGVNASDTVGLGDTNPTTYQGIGQQFGYYTLVPGTTMTAKPYGQGSPQTIGGTIGGVAGQSGGYGYGVVTPYTYTIGPLSEYSRGGPYDDSMAAVLGYHWERLREGDKVTVKVIHTPTGKVIFSKDVPVTEG